jgi:CTP synthase (UTP-ammonia lyase)
VAVTAAIAIVGDFDPANETHRATDDALGHVSDPLDFEWVATDEVGDGEWVESRSGVFVAPASPYRSMEGALTAIRQARERGVPLVGT